MDTIVNNSSDFDGMEDESGSFSDFMMGIENDMLNLMKETAKAPSTMLEHWNAFSAAIDWTENWIRILIAFHVLTITIVYITKNNSDIQSVLFLLLCAMVVMAERLNTFCAVNWQLFSKQNYFDEHGVFASLLYAGPLLLICLFQLLNFLRLASSSLIKAKRLELRSKYGKNDPSSTDDDFARGDGAVGGGYVVDDTSSSTVVSTNSRAIGSIVVDPTTK